MTLEIINCEQGSEEWHKLRLGMPTASRFADIMAKGDGKMRSKYMRELAGERITGEPAENFSNGAMQRGRDMEDELRRQYLFEHGSSRDGDITRIGFAHRKIGEANFDIGCSPDALIGEHGILEIKSVTPHLLIERLESAGFPMAHYYQCLGSLLVTGRKWCDLVLGYRKMPMRRWRLFRDDEEGKLRLLVEELERFDYETRKMLKRITSS